MSSELETDAPKLGTVERILLDDKKILGIICLNALVLFVLCFSQLPEEARQSLNRVDDLFTLVFVFECVAKIRRYGWREYWASHWNKFDFVLVVLALPSPVFQLLDIGVQSNALLAIRICRVFKFFRSLRFVPGIDNMLEGIVRALKSSLMLLIGFSIGMFMITILCCKLFGEIAPEHFGDPLRSLYSVFKIFTVEGWFEVPDEVAGHLHGAPKVLTQIFFSGILLVCGILGLSLVNSVFVDAMVADNNDALESKIDALQSDLRAMRALLEQRAEAERGGDDPPGDGSPQG